MGSKIDESTLKLADIQHHAGVGSDLPWYVDAARHLDMKKSIPAKKSLLLHYPGQTEI